VDIHSSRSELQAQLQLLEVEYAEKFTGLNNHLYLHSLWQRIQKLRSQLEEIASEPIPADALQGDSN
jgi:hypothetical protein